MSGLQPPQLDEGANGSRRGSRFRVNVVDEISPTSKTNNIETAPPNMASFYNPGYTPAVDDDDSIHQESNGGDAILRLRKETLANERKESVMSYGNVNDGTMERPPNLNYYRNKHSMAGITSARPTLRELHAADLPEEIIDEEEFNLGLGGDGEVPEPKQIDPADATLQRMPEPNAKQPVKFGWIQGVFIRCVLNIVGVMLYLRLSWVAGQAGLGLASVVVLLSSAVTFITSLSMCAICTNGEIKGGGAYFMISRSLGAEFGGSIGIVFTLANVLGAAMHCVGFAETVRDLLIENNACIVDCALMDTRIFGWVTATFLMAIIFIGISFEAKAQLVFLVILIISLINYWVGTMIPPSTQDRAEGLTWYSWTTLKENFLPHFRDGETFFTIFGIYFPSATGIMAGANISGDLKDPSKAIPKGTLLAILVTTLLYLSVVWTTGSSCIRYASGKLGDYYNGTLTDCAAYPDNNVTKCEYGLMNYYHVMELDSGYRYLVTAGIFAATLSSALASLVSAPKIFQAVARDPLYPFIHHLAKGYGKGDEPRRVYIITFLLVMGVIGLGDLNAIAPYVSNFFLASYCLVNYATFAASFSETPGFRPSFRYYNMWVSLLGAVLCVAIMFVINYIAAIVTLIFVFLLYVFVWYRKPEVNWGSSSQAAVYKAALQKVQKLQTTEEHVKNYRPQILVLTGNPVARPSLVDFAANVTKDISLLACGHVILMNPTSRVLNSIHKLNKQVVSWLKKRRIKAFYCPIASPNMLTGVQSLNQLSGLSRLRPNILLMGFKSNWTSDNATEQVIEYFRIINCAFDSHMGVGILRVPGGLDFSDPMNELQMKDAKVLHMPEPSNNPSIAVFDIDESEDGVLDSNGSLNRSAINSRRGSIDLLEAAQNSTVLGTPLKNPQIKRLLTVGDQGSIGGGGGGGGTSNGSFLNVRMTEARPSLADIAQLSMDVRKMKSDKSKQKNNNDTPASLRSSVWTTEHKEVLSSINRFRIHEKKAIIDVWWLFDDGGLTLFIPHMLTLPKSYLEGAKLRVFTVASRRSAIEEEQRSMIKLLNKFRIDYQDVFLIPDITRKPKMETLKEFDHLIKPFKAETEKSDQKNLSSSGYITDSELSNSQQRTYRQLRTRELLLQHSYDASLIVMTLPVPRQGKTSPFLYMAWLEMLTRGMPPMLLLRGNQQSVLTFYS